MPGAYVYLMDRFYPVEFSFGELVELYDQDPMKVFESIRSLVESKLGSKIHHVEIYKSFVNREKGAVLLEYMASFENGTLGVKVIHAEDPSKAIFGYYDAEKKRC